MRQYVLLGLLFIIVSGCQPPPRPIILPPPTTSDTAVAAPLSAAEIAGQDGGSEELPVALVDSDGASEAVCLPEDSESEYSADCADISTDCDAATDLENGDCEVMAADALSDGEALGWDMQIQFPDNAARDIPCLSGFDELLATVPPAAIAPLTGLNTELLAFNHVRVREQFASWYGGCKTQAKLHRALDRGEQIYFPIIDQAAREYFPEALQAAPGETPLVDVLKALTVVESLVNTNAISWAGAGGPWQFMRGTFKRISKRIGQEDPYPIEDLRFDWYAASRAGFELTQENLRAFQWTKSPLACAIMAYNGGISRVSQALKRQNKNDCRQLKYTKYSARSFIAHETYRYQPRIVMVLMIMAWRRANGYNLQPLSAYQPTELRGEGPVRLQELAAKAGVDYQLLVKMNRRYPLGVTPTGQWSLEVAEESLPALQEALPQVERLSDERITAMLNQAAPMDIVLLLGEDAFRYYRVKSGDNVSSICRRFKVTRAQLMQLNRSLFAKNKKRSGGREWTLYVGQRLRLPGIDQLLFK